MTTQTRPDGTALDVWPALPYAEWKETCATLHMWTQIVGKVKLALTPFLNEWWNVAFHLTARGLTTCLIPRRLIWWRRAGRRPPARAVVTLAMLR